MSKSWQLVDIHGEIVNEDDTSSIGSDWSFMQFDLENGCPSRPQSECGSYTCFSQDDNDNLDDEYKPSTENLRTSNQRYSSLTRQRNIEPLNNSTLTNTTLNLTNTHHTLNNRTNLTSGQLRSKKKLYFNSNLQNISLPNPTDSKHITKRWNATRRYNNNNNRTNFNVDLQKSKCLYRGALINNGFQRHQTRLISNGCISHQRS